MMKRILLCLLAAVTLAPAAGAVPAPSGGDGPLSLSAGGAVLMEKETGTVLFEKSAHEPLSPASVTKVMTMLLVMEALDSGRVAPEDPVTVSARAAGMGGSQVYLREGEQLSVSEMLKCVAVVSGNDCAVALAEHLSGSEEAFVREMNEKAQALGMEDTCFLNCTGLPAPGHLTSAHDVALMSRELILRHPGIRDYTTVWTDSIREGSFGLTNTNRLIRFYPGATGLKTGSTQSALFCLSATAEREGMELIAVVLHCPTSAQRFEDARSLLDYGFARYALADVRPKAPLPPIPVLLGKQGYIQPEFSTSCRVLVEKSRLPELTAQLDLAQDLEAPVEKGQRVGTLRVLLSGREYSSIPICSSQSAERLTYPGVCFRLLELLLMSRA